MADECCAPDLTDHSSPRWIRVLRIALVLNFVMFCVEVVASHTSGSMSLRADALDFLGDSFNYGMSLWVAGSVLRRRAQVSLVKGATMALFGIYILFETCQKMREGILPSPPTMELIGALAFVVNLAVALMLYRYRDGDSNMQSVWLCTRNDVIGNLLVIAAAALVHSLNSGWPDWIAGALLALLSVQSGLKVLRVARSEIAA